MLSPLETGTTWGRPWERGRSRETGPRMGAWHPRAARRDSKARQLAGLGEARSGKAPHLIHGGPCLILVGSNVLFQDRGAGNRRNATRDAPVTPGSAGEFPRGRAATGGGRRGSCRARRPDQGHGEHRNPHFA